MSKYTITFQNENGEMVKREMTEIEETELEASLVGANEVPDIRTIQEETPVVDDLVEGEQP